MSIEDVIKAIKSQLQLEESEDNDSTENTNFDAKRHQLEKFFKDKQKDSTQKEPTNSQKIESFFVKNERKILEKMDTPENALQTVKDIISKFIGLDKNGNKKGFFSNLGSNFDKMVKQINKLSQSVTYEQIIENLNYSDKDETNPKLILTHRLKEILSKAQTNSKLPLREIPDEVQRTMLHDVYSIKPFKYCIQKILNVNYGQGSIEYDATVDQVHEMLSKSMSELQMQLIAGKLQEKIIKTLENISNPMISDLIPILEHLEENIPKGVNEIASYQDIRDGSHTDRTPYDYAYISLVPKYQVLKDVENKTVREQLNEQLAILKEFDIDEMNTKYETTSEKNQEFLDKAKNYEFPYTDFDKSLQEAIEST